MAPSYSVLALTLDPPQPFDARSSLANLSFKAVSQAAPSPSDLEPATLLKAASLQEPSSGCPQPSVPAPFADLEKMCHSPLAPGAWHNPEANADQKEPRVKSANQAFPCSEAQNREPRVASSWETTYISIGQTCRGHRKRSQNRVNSG